MKEKFKIASAFLCGALLFSGVSFAATGDFVAKTSKFKIVVNGKEQKLAKSPVTIDGSAYVPVRDVGSITGYEVGFKNGVISLDNEAVIIDHLNTTTTTNVSTESDVIKFKKLPITIEKNGISVTVNRVSQGENSTDLDVTVVNSLDSRKNIRYDLSMGSNLRVEGIPFSTKGTFYGKENFPSMVAAKETINGIITKEKVSSGTKNIVFHIEIGASTYSFYIDTDGDL
ncbi:stalk domain-containing protein [Paenibacillus tianjinensis]|uniref:Copper amine oxidase-like N-terminal domain-containing protein n=1 Tax=Paenibacillus tianjinensis TaxID=2810347 RepID=A0ABX7L5Z7_9BACL|nr:stalk domain-containing protein [Paenibacillus tianjinensis]QSF43550.1 hypothetical protein JRJ22_20020 [Paenibacillus tianjinensis]